MILDESISQTHHNFASSRKTSSKVTSPMNPLKAPPPHANVIRFYVLINVLNYLALYTLHQHNSSTLVDSYSFSITSNKLCSWRDKFF